MNELCLRQLIGAEPWFQNLTLAAKTAENALFPGRNSGILYLGAGAVQQMWFNRQHGYRSDFAFKDLDIVYYDKEETPDSGREQEIAAVLTRGMARHARWPIDVKNQALVHHWYGRRFGYAIDPYESLDDAVGTWPTTSTAIALALTTEAMIAPFGLHDLSAMIIRANRRQIREEIYAAKTARWRQSWPELIILPWSEGVDGP